MTETVTDVRKQMRGFIDDNFLYLRPDVELGDGDDFLALGVIDSLGFVELVEENFLYLKPDLQVSTGDDLLVLGVIDSLGFVELVEEVQSRYGVTVTDIEITEENFGSIDAIAAFVERKQAGT